VCYLPKIMLADDVGGVQHQPPPNAKHGNLDPQAPEILQHLKVLLQGQELTTLSVGALRHALALRLGLQPLGLDARREEIAALTLASHT